MALIHKRLPGPALKHSCVSPRIGCLEYMTKNSEDPVKHPHLVGAIYLLLLVSAGHHSLTYIIASKHFKPMFVLSTVWREGVSGYSLSNEDKMACKDGDDTANLYSAGRLYTCGHSVAFRIVDVGAVCVGDGIALTVSERESEPLVSSGSLFVDVSGELIGRSVFVDVSGQLIGRSVSVDVSGQLIGRSVFVDVSGELIGRP